MERRTVSLLVDMRGRLCCILADLDCEFGQTEAKREIEALESVKSLIDRRLREDGSGQ